VNGRRVNPDEEVHEIAIEAPKGEYIVNTVGNIGLKLMETGVYEIIIETLSGSKWEKAGSVSIEVVATDQK
jgi:hypothetical protein